MHAHVPALEARLVELQAELAPLLDRHQELAEALPWARQLVRIYACRVHGLTYIHAVSKPAASPASCSHGSACPHKPKCCSNA